MTDFNGALSIAAFQKNIMTSDYGDAAETLGATDQIPFISAEISGERAVKMPDIIDGSYGRQVSYQTGHNVAGNVVLPLFYEGGIEDLIALALGYENPNDDAVYNGSPHNYATGVYKHIYECDDTAERYGWTSGEDRLPSGSGGGVWDSGDKKVRAFTLGFARQVSDHKLVDAMINQLTLTGDTESIQASLDIVAQTEARGSYGSGNWTLKTNLQNNYDDLIIKPAQLVVTVKTTVIYVTRWELVIQNLLAVDNRTADSQLILEPMRNDFIQCTFSFELPRYAADTWLDLKDAGDAEYASIEYTGPQIGATGKYYQFGLFLPKIDYFDVQTPNVTGPGPTNHMIEGKAFRCPVASVPGVWTDSAVKLKDITLIKDGPVICMFQNGNTENIFGDY